MKILVADRISPSGVEYLKEQDGAQVTEAYGSTPEQILELVTDVDAIIVRSETKITKEVMEAAPKLKAVGRAGVGVDNIDVDAATERGIVVMNTPSGNTIATAELTFTHMLCGTRPVAQANASMQSGEWNRKAFSGNELNNKTLGILGLGRIGTEVSTRAKAFGMNVVAYDPYLTATRAESLGLKQVDLDALFSQSDYITVHMPLTDETRYIVDELAFSKMKDGVRIFNCARGGIIKEDALVEALNSGKVAAAGLDVYEDEPLAKDSPLRGIDKLVLTPHLGASTQEAQESVGVEIAVTIAKVLQGETVSNALNMPSVDPNTLELLKPYLQLGKRLGTIAQQLSPKQVEKLKITYSGKIMDLDAMPLTRSIQRGYLKKISSSDINDVNAPMFMSRLGIQVDIVKSNENTDFTELVRVETFTSSGESVSVSGTLIGKKQRPRLVEINGHQLEVEPTGALLMMKNRDVPGIVGRVGTIIGEHKLNIGNLSLARSDEGRTAFAVFELDSDPGHEAAKAIRELEEIQEVFVVTI